MEDTEFLALSSLFDAIGVIEKGIERIYHYLLINKRIDNLKEVASKYNLTLKRGYKICSVLNDLGLIQIYDRPMKIHLANPPDSIWQAIVNDRIDKLTLEFQEKKERAENALVDFIRQYQLEESATQEFVEFINYNLNNFDDTYYSFMAKSQCKIALGIRYENELTSVFKKNSFQNIPENLRESMKTGMIKIKENVKNIDLKVIFNAELIKELLNSKEFELLSNHVDTFKFTFGSVDVHVTYDDFSNFSLTDHELIQPSFDPTNRLIGAYVSRNKNIYQIFNDKFNELYAKGISISQFLREQEEITLPPITESQIFSLCLL
jgi:sugar-specific transcriptional regulator TrmB